MTKYKEGQAITRGWRRLYLSFLQGFFKLKSVKPELVHKTVPGYQLNSINYTVFCRRGTAKRQRHQYLTCCIWTYKSSHITTFVK